MEKKEEFFSFFVVVENGLSSRPKLEVRRLTFFPGHWKRKNALPLSLLSREIKNDEDTSSFFLSARGSLSPGLLLYY